VPAVDDAFSFAFSAGVLLVIISFFLFLFCLFVLHLSKKQGVSLPEEYKLLSNLLFVGWSVLN